MENPLLKENMLSEVRQNIFLGLKIAILSINLSKNLKKVGKSRNFT